MCVYVGGAGVGGWVGGVCECACLGRCVCVCVCVSVCLWGWVRVGVGGCVGFVSKRLGSSLDLLPRTRVEPWIFLAAALLGSAHWSNVSSRTSLMLLSRRTLDSMRRPAQLLSSNVS